MLGMKEETNAQPQETTTRKDSGAQEQELECLLFYLTYALEAVV